MKGIFLDQGVLASGFVDFGYGSLERKREREREREWGGEEGGREEGGERGKGVGGEGAQGETAKTLHQPQLKLNYEPKFVMQLPISC